MCESLPKGKITSFTQFSLELQPQAQRSVVLICKVQLQPCNVNLS